MPEARIRTLVEPTGTKLVRLRELPLEERTKGYAKLVRNGDLTPEEAERLLTVVIDPGDVGGRIAA